jgi:glutamine synthetase
LGAIEDEPVFDIRYENLLLEVRLIPDKSTFRIVPWSKKLGMVLSNLVNLDGTPFNLCPR